MKKSDVKKWVKALRSGGYRQGQENLCKEDEISGDCDYCCLGVACDILIEGDWVKPPHWKEWGIGNPGKHKVFGFPAISIPSLETLKEMGLDLAYAKELAKLNDKGWSFKKIANKIEKDLL
jgi:hypothetical protein